MALSTSYTTYFQATFNVWLTSERKLNYSENKFIM